MSSKRAAIIDKRNQKHRDAADRAADGFVRTPAKLADEIVSGHRDFGAFPRGARVLDPSAGDGRLVVAMLAGDPDVHVVAVEPNDRRADALDVIAADNPGRVTVVRGRFEDYAAGYTGDPFDGVVMNPPFGDSSRDLVWVDHVRAAHEMMRPGALLVAIVPASYEWRNTRVHDSFRAWAKENAATFRRLPGQPFAESGTGATAGVLTIPRPMPARPDGLPGWVYAPVTGAPVTVKGLPVVTSVGALTMPVQEYSDWADGYRPRVLRYAGECFGCRRILWAHDDRHDAATFEGSTFDAADHGQAGPSVCACLDCYHGGAEMEVAALALAAPHWSPATDDPGQAAAPTVYPLDLGEGLWATVHGPDRDREARTITGRLMADPEAAAPGVVERARDRVRVLLRTAGGRDFELFPLATQTVIVRDVPADVVPAPTGEPMPDHGVFMAAASGAVVQVASVRHVDIDAPASTLDEPASAPVDVEPEGFVSSWGQFMLPV